MGRYRRSRTHKAIKDISKKYRLRRRTKDLDQIQDEMKRLGEAAGNGEYLSTSERLYKEKSKLRRVKITEFLNRNIEATDEALLASESAVEAHALQDLPAGGEYRCIECSRYFISENAISEHRRGKLHKKRFT